MAIGASFGRMLGTVAQELHRTHPKWALFAHCAPDTPCITPATYAFLGAAAAMCGVTKVTVSVVVIMYELTGALNFLVPTMIVVMVARIIGDAIVEGGISEQLILLNGIPFLDEDSAEDDAVVVDEQDQRLLGLPVAALMRTCDGDMCVLPASGLSLDRLVRMVETTPNIRGYPVVDNEQDMRLVGYVLRSAVVRVLVANQLYSIIDGALQSGANASLPVIFGAAANIAIASVDGGTVLPLDLTELVNTSPVSVRPRTSAETTIKIFRKMGPRVILVTSDEDSGQLVGLLTRKDVLRYMRQRHN
ncbi:glycerol ethanol, ferric requiring protein [Coemansia guatemalensis]|uniref:Chloride channel protein n=1 Tax=Coemansia guatemalensis TaxID=2761395 RepID=A0A9W8I1I2_9FUNG|nr:glycerol ethanol, ferric requiring protein [Coemansia guatemalensis]